MKFKSNIELQAGLEDNNAASGTTGQVLSSTGTGVEWIDQSALTDVQSNFVYFDVKNETGSTINKGKGVMAVGTDGNSGHILIDEMVADGSVEPKYFLGVLETTVANGGFARVISFGQLDQFDTRGQNGETWSDGQILWCDPDSDGDFTITEPDGPNVKIAAAIVLNAATNGKIQVRVQANEGIHDLYDTKITSQVDGDILVWNNTDSVWFNDSTLNVDYTNSNVGIGTDSPSAKLNIVDSNPKIVLEDSDNAGTFGQIRQQAGNLQFLSNNNTSNGTIQFKLDDGTNTTDAMYIASSGNVGIGTTNPTEKLQLGEITSGGAGASPDAITLGRTFSDTAGQNLKIRVYDDGVNHAGFGVSSGKLDYSVWSSGANHVFYAGSSELMRIKGSGNVGIGTASPGDKLQVAGNAIIQDYAYIGDGVQHWGDGGTGMNFPANDTIDLATSSTSRIRINSSGNVGIGTTSPSAKLDVAGNVSISNTATARLDISGGGNGYVNAAVSLRTTDDNTNRGNGIYSYNDARGIEWFFGNPYNTSDSFSINRRTGATGYSESTADPSYSIFTVSSNGDLDINGRLLAGDTSLASSHMFYSADDKTIRLRGNDNWSGIGFLGNTGTEGFLYHNSVGQFFQMTHQNQMLKGFYVPDNEKGYFGTSNDLEIYHNGTHSFINNAGTGEIIFQDAGNNIWFSMGNGIFLYDNKKLYLGNGGDLEIYHNGTDSYINQTGSGALINQVNEVNVAYWRGDATAFQFFDNKKISLGNSQDLQLYHNGTDTYIDNLTGDTYLRITDTSKTFSIFTDNSLGTNQISGIFGGDNSEVILYYGGSKKFETTATGVDITGNLDVSGTGTFASIILDGATTYLRPNTNGTQTLNIGGNGAGIVDWNQIRVYTNGSNDFLWNNEIVATQDWVGFNYQPLGTYNTVIGTDTDISLSGYNVLGSIVLEDGVITSSSSRALSNLYIKDTRGVWETPDNFNRELELDFKQNSAVGNTLGNTYSGVMTIAPWNDPSGGQVHQLFFSANSSTTNEATDYIAWRTGDADGSTTGDWGTLRKLATQDWVTTQVQTVDTLDEVTQNANWTEQGIVVRDSIIKVGSSTGTNQVDSGTIDFLEDTDNDFGAVGGYGFRLNYNGDTNDFTLQSGNETTVSNVFSVDRGATATFEILRNTDITGTLDVTGNASAPNFNATNSVTASGFLQSPLWIAPVSEGSVTKKAIRNAYNNMYFYYDYDTFSYSLAINETGRVRVTNNDLLVDNTATANVFTSTQNINVGNDLVVTGNAYAPNLLSLSNADINIIPNGTGEINLNKSTNITGTLDVSGVITGNGSGLTNVDADTLDGMDSSAFALAGDEDIIDGAYSIWDPDGSGGDVFNYNDSNPIHNGKYVGAIINVRGDGAELSSLLRAGTFSGDHVSVSRGYYVGSILNTASADTTQVIDGSGNWTGNQIGSNKLPETKYVFTDQLGTNNNIDTNYRAGMFSWSPTTTGTTPSDAYGQGINIVSMSHEHNDTNNWITQLAFGTNKTSSYFRTKVNTGAWSGWHTIWNSANDGSGSGMDADLLDGVHGSSFLRSDTTDTAGGKLSFQYYVTDLNNVNGAIGVTPFRSSLQATNRAGTGNYNTGLEFTYHDSQARTQLVASSSGSNNTGELWVRSESWGATPTWSNWFKLLHTGNFTAGIDYNAIIGTDTDINTSGATVIDQLNMTDGVIQSHSTRTLSAADLGISQPNPPTLTALNIVGETIEVVFDKSTTAGVDKYEVWSSVAGGSFGLIANIPTEDIAPTMTAVDAAFSVSGTQAYRVYAIKNGIYSVAATGSTTFSTPSLSVVNMSVINLNPAYYIQYDLPDSRFIDHIEIYMDVETTSSSLSRTGASLIYSGSNSSYMYQIGASDLDKFHQFWVEVVAS